jgi:uncharacterized membrane protein
MMGLSYGHRGFGPGAIGLGGIGAVIGFLVLLGFVALVVLFVVSASRRHGMARPASPPPSDQAIQIARERLARGEIDADQYTRILASLNGAALPPNPS